MDNETPQTNVNHHAVIIGEGTLADAVADVMKSRDIPVSKANLDSLDADVKAMADAGNPPSLIFNMWFPQPNADKPETLAMYSQVLLEQSLNVTDLLKEQTNPAIINFAFLPAIYVGTDLEDHAASLRGSITGVTRTLARKFGKANLRVSCVQAGLVDMPETQSWVSDTVKEVKVPTKRWATPEEVAKFCSFLAVDSLYTTGQTMIIDGGLTAGITGT